MGLIENLQLNESTSSRVIDPDNGPYFLEFEGRNPPMFRPLSMKERLFWHFFAGASVAASIRYLYWRWAESMNPEAILFSFMVALAETLTIFGTILFYFDIWDEGDTPWSPPMKSQNNDPLDQIGEILVDIFITTVDEDEHMLEATVEAARNVIWPINTEVRVYILDDGNRSGIELLASRQSVSYIARSAREGFKGGNLSNALFRTKGDFVVICDADTRLFPTFLKNTLGYFSKDDVAWVQTPHWFYDLPCRERWGKRLARVLKLHSIRMPIVAGLFSGPNHGEFDPFFSDPSVFFDIIQRRRNRNASSFCCGAASIHRREAIFSSALGKKLVDSVKIMKVGGLSNLTEAAECVPLEPFRFHVSEDLYSSILAHGSSGKQWESVYHPKVEARMLSPWSVQAWASQRVKYARGTFDIAFRSGSIFGNKMSWKTKLHYLSTFWSYASSLWVPILIFAPAYSLVSGYSAVKSFSSEFFWYFVPMVVFGELALMSTSKNLPLSKGRVLNAACMFINLRAFFFVVSGRRPGFNPTTKIPSSGGAFRYILPNVAAMFILAFSGLFSLLSFWCGWSSPDYPAVYVNLFWLSCNFILMGQIFRFIFWNPAAALRVEN